MTEQKITYQDLKEYESLFTLAPSFVLGAMIKRNQNLVKKFNKQVKSYLNNLNEDQKEKLDIILESDVEQLQEVMKTAYSKTKKKQFKLLSEPKAREFITYNLNEIKKIV